MLDIFSHFSDIDQPKLFVSPINKVPENSDVILECLVDSNPKITNITWYHNGKYISTSRSNGNTLELYNVSPDSAGLYHCNVMYENEKYFSDGVSLEVDCKLHNYKIQNI